MYHGAHILRSTSVLGRGQDHTTYWAGPGERAWHTPEAEGEETQQTYRREHAYTAPGR